jgi:hypothetical protein
MQATYRCHEEDIDRGHYVPPAEWAINCTTLKEKYHFTFSSNLKFYLYIALIVRLQHFLPSS